MITQSSAQIKVSESFNQISNKSGSKKKHTKAKATTRLYIRLTVSEREQLNKLAGNQTVSAYVREKALGEHVEKRRILRKPQMEDIQYAMLLSALGQSRLSANVNQLAKHANTGTLDCSQDVEEQLEEACAALFAMRNALFLALGHRQNASGKSQ